MVADINHFIIYLRDIKKTSKNTEVSYQRDLIQMASFLGQQGIMEVDKVTKTSLNSYILFLEKRRQSDYYHFTLSGFHESIFPL